MRESRRPARWLMCALLITVLPSFSIAMPAGAAGNAELSQQIISNPVPGYVPIANSSLQSEVNYLNQIEQSAIGPAGGKASAAADGWHDPSAKLGIAIILDAFNYPQGVNFDLAKNSAAAGLSFCDAGTSAVPVSDTPIAGIPDSHLVMCQKLASGAQPMVAAWGKANVLGMVVTSVAAMSPDKLASIATQQYNAMSSLNTAVGSGSNTGLILGLVAAGVVVLAVVAAIVLVVRARRRSAADQLQLAVYRAAMPGPVIANDTSAEGAVSSPPEDPPAGWYEDPANLSGRRYWTGSDWGPAEEQAEPVPQALVTDPDEMTTSD